MDFPQPLLGGAEVVQLSTSYPVGLLDFNLGNGRHTERKNFLDAYAIRNLTHGNGRSGLGAMPPTYDHTFKNLHALLFLPLRSHFSNFLVHAHERAGFNVRVEGGIGHT